MPATHFRFVTPSGKSKWFPIELEANMLVPKDAEVEYRCPRS